MEALRSTGLIGKVGRNVPALEVCDLGRAKVVRVAKAQQHGLHLGQAVRPLMASINIGLIKTRSKCLGRLEHVESLAAEPNTRFQTAPRAECLAKLEAAGIPAGPLNDVADAVSSPQVHARKMLVEVAGGSVDGMKVAGNPIKLSGHQDPPTRGPVPELDADRASVLELVRDK